MFFIQLTIAETGKTVFLNPENIGYMGTSRNLPVCAAGVIQSPL